MISYSLLYQLLLTSNKQVQNRKYLKLNSDENNSRNDGYECQAMDISRQNVFEIQLLIDKENTFAKQDTNSNQKADNSQIMLVHKSNWFLLVILTICSLLMGSYGQEFPLRVISPNSSFFFWFEQQLYITGNSNTDRFTVNTTIGQSVNSSNYLDLVLGINYYHINNTITGIYLDYNLTITTNSITIILLTENFTTNFSNDYLHLTGMFFLMQKNAPYLKQRITQNPSQTLHGPSGTIISKIYPINFNLTSQLTQNCYTDSSGTIRDQIILIPTLVMLDQRNISYINSTADGSNAWFFNWNSSTTSLPFNFVVYSKNGTLNSFTLDVLAICINSYFFTSRNMVFNFVNLQLPNPPPTHIIDDSVTSFTVSTSMGGTAFDPASYYSQFQSVQTLVFQNYQPPNMNGAFLAVGQGLNCPSNYKLLNKTNCFCNSSLYLYYQPIFSNSSCTPYCPNNTFYSNSSFTCETCSEGYGPACTNCTNLSCISCQAGYKLFSNTIPGCVNCSNFSIGCIDCTTQDCLKCSANYIISARHCYCLNDRYIDLNNTNCILCNSTFVLCLQCTPTECLVCAFNAFVSNGSCQCYEYYSISSDQSSCILCEQLYGLGCEVCTNKCISCSSGMGLFTSIGNTTCQNCSIIYNQLCLTCNNTNCLSCDNNFTLGSNHTCICTSPYLIQIGIECLNCSMIHNNCLTCNNNGCLLCLNNYISINGECACSDDRFLIGKLCILCANLYLNCLKCSPVGCWQCTTNFTLVGQQCQCPSSNILTTINSTIFCLACEAVFPAQNCNLLINISSIQVGNELYFWFYFSKPQNEVVSKISLRYNLRVTQGTKEMQFNSDENDIFSLKIDSYGKNTINFYIPRKDYIVWNEIELQNDPNSINVGIVNELFISQDFIKKLFEILNKLLFSFIFLSFGPFNRCFQQTNIASMLVYQNQNMNNSLGTVLNILNQQRTYTLFPSATISFDTRIITTSDPKFQIYKLNTPLIQFTQQIVIVSACSLLLFAYIRGYLKSKRRPRQHFAFRNILDYGSEYIIENILTCYSMLSLPILLQISVMKEDGVTSFLPILNLAATLLFLIMPFILFALSFKIFAPGSKRYSIAYSSLKSQNSLALFLHVFIFLRIYAISGAVVFFSENVAKYIVLGINSIHIVMIMFNVHNFLNKISFGIKLAKSMFGILLSIAICVNNEGICLLMTTASYCLILLVAIQIIQGLIKITQLVMRNKGIISDITPIQNRQIEVTTTANKQKIILFETLNKAKDELKDMLQRRKKKI